MHHHQDLVTPNFDKPYLPTWLRHPHNYTFAETAVRMYLDMTRHTFGLCVPSGCSKKEVYDNYAALYGDIGAGAVPLSCQTRSDQDEIKKWDTETYWAL